MPQPWAYWLLVALLVLLVVVLGIVVGQRDKAQMNLGLYRDALWRADPEEAKALAFVTGRRR